MQDIVVESTRAAVLIGIVVFLWHAGKARFEHTRKGWNLIIVGFVLLWFGSLIDITDNFESLNRFVIIGDTEAQAILEKFVGFLGGFVVLAVGLFQWIPSVQQLTDEINERKKTEEALNQAHTEMQNYAAELDQALKKEKELCGLQRQFVSMVSHEFRTPLAIIDGNAQRLTRRPETATPDNLKKVVGKIRTSVKRLTELMESVLVAARLEDSQIRFEPGPCSLANLIEEICSSHGEIYTNHKITSDLSRLPGQIIGDRKLLRQVFSNLISNAVKYSPDATEIWIDGRTDNHGNAVVTVRDEGVGIPAAELDKLFKRFFRASTSAGIMGTGIGLHLVKAMVDMHGGQVDIASTEGEGSTFSILLPISPPVEASLKEAA